MSRTRILKQQHEAALSLVKEVTAACDGQLDDLKAFRISLLLAKLTGLLRIHFAQEDECIYPQMEASADSKTASTAQSFREEMGGLGANYMVFAEKWSTARTIASDFACFKRESGAIFAALGRRIERENRELYPLADAMRDESGLSTTA